MSTVSKVAKKIFYDYTMEAILLIIALYIAFTTRGFFTLANLLNVLQNTSLKGVIAFGMTMVIICGEIDLSISSTVAISGIITALVAGSGVLPMGPATLLGMALALALSLVMGFINGFIRTKFGIPTFIITLAMLNFWYGIAALLSKGFPVTSLPSWYSVFGAGQLLGIPVPAIILLIVFGAVALVMERTKFGRSVYAVGGNPESARLSGIDVTKVKIIVMMSVQLMAAVSGIMMSSQVMSGAHSFGKTWEMDVIASVIIGGASMNGGIGRVRGTFVGIIFLGIIVNGMTLKNVNEYVQYVVRGGLIIMAVLINTMQQRRKSAA